MQCLSRIASVKAGEEVTVNGWDEKFDASLFQMNSKTKAGVVSAECSEDVTVALDVVITEQLKKEGAVRDVIRQSQLLRKEAGYQVEQRIVVSMASDDEFIASALAESKDHIAAELLADDVVFGSLDSADLSKDVEVAGATVTISVKKA